MRCLPNPFWDITLRGKSGQDQEVIDFLNAQPLANKMFEDISQFLENWLPHYIESNRSYITVAIGCTGGQHRSVFLAERLGKYFEQQQPDVQIRHRDVSHSKELT